MAEEESSPSKSLTHYGLDLKEAYRLTLKFYKENEGKSVQLNYDQKLKLVALTQQANHGTFSEENSPALGALDVIGKDRRSAWVSLGDISKDESMKGFIDGVAESMPHLQPHIEAIKKEKESIKKQELEAQEKAAEEAKIAQEADEERQRQEEQRRQIQDALNRQSYEEFRAYAEQQYPDNPDQQAILIRQLQEQHYYQYMQQLYQQQQMTVNQANQDQTVAAAAASVQPPDTALPEGGQEALAAAASVNVTSDFAAMTLSDEANENSQNENVENDDEEHDCTEECGFCEDEEDFQLKKHEEILTVHEHECTEECGFCDMEGDEQVTPASMWTKKEVAEFKDSIRNEGGDSIIKVSHGETVTVRVPTHKDGTALFWEFATDHYDLAFGLFFEWTETEETEVSVHISDSEDEDIDDEYNEDDENGDPENGVGGAGGSSRALMDPKGPPTSVIIPIFRRDCHQEVYAGTHTYPGRGVYLLKFDNTYSLWRSKTLYYRVYYTR